MTVAELVEALQCCDPAAHVVCWDGHYCLMTSAESDRVRAEHIDGWQGQLCSAGRLVPVVVLA